MLFNSWPFWGFLAVVLPLYWIVPHRWQNPLLLFASYVFYGSWDWRFLSLIWFSTALNYYLGGGIAAAPEGRARHRLVAAAVTANLALLGVFKYYDFFAHELSSLLGAIGVPASLPLLHVLLPVGISFYTFQSMSYLIDISRNVTQPSPSLIDFALYVAFFPNLVAGPIMRSGTTQPDPLGRGLLTQVMAPRVTRSDDFEEGLYHVLIGLFKKVVIGDNMASLVNTVFGTPTGQLSGLECLFGVYAFAWQVYADFSGYSSIAQGVAKWMGIDLMYNFRMPYLSRTPGEFWQRWHISLSTWLRDYLFLPLSYAFARRIDGVRWLGLRDDFWIYSAATMITMLLCGLWHGAAWTFVLWGGYHGALLVVHRLWSGGRRRRLAKRGRGGAREIAGRLLVPVVMFHVWCLGWLFFRAESVQQAAAFLRAIGTDWRMTPFAGSMIALLLVYTIPLLAFEIWTERRGDMVATLRVPWPVRGFAYGVCLIVLIVFASPSVHEFIYFQF